MCIDTPPAGRSYELSTFEILALRPWMKRMVLPKGSRRTPPTFICLKEFLNMNIFDIPDFFIGCMQEACAKRPDKRPLVTWWKLLEELLWQFWFRPVGHWFFTVSFSVRNFWDTWGYWYFKQSSFQKTVCPARSASYEFLGFVYRFDFSSSIGVTSFGFSQSWVI